MIKWFIYLLALVSLSLSFYWGISQNQRLEPWSAFISAILFFAGLFSKNNNPENQNTQNSFFSFFSKSKMKNPKGNNRQSNLFGIGNSQDIEFTPDKTVKRKKKKDKSE